MSAEAPVGIPASALIGPPPAAILGFGLLLATNTLTKYRGAELGIPIGIVLLATLMEIVLLPVAVYALITNPNLRSRRQSMGIGVGICYLVAFFASWGAGI